MTRWPRVLSWCSGATAVAGVCGLLTTGFLTSRAPARADDRPFFGIAAADGVRVSFGIKGYLVVEQFADVGGPSAQASVDTLNSTGYAAYPYPGDTVLAAPGLASGSGGVPVADYPLIATSSPSSPEATVAQGPYNLHAKSTDSASQATARADGAKSDPVVMGSTVATAEADHQTDSGTVVSTAESTAESITVAGVLRIGRAHAKAVVSAPGSGDPAQKTSEFEAEGMTVAGQAVALTPDGLGLPGSTVPLPPSDPINQALSQGGITVTYLAPQTDPDGVVSAGMKVDIVHDIPSAPNPGVFTLVFGQARAAGHGGAGGLSSTTNGSSSILGADQSPDVGSPPSAGARVSTGSAPIPSVTTPAPTTSAAPAQAAGNGGAATTRNVAPAPAGTTRSETASFYLVLVLASVFAFGGVQLIRYFGVRLAWSS